MDSEKTLLFVGHSHVECIAAAIRKNNSKTAHVLNISGLVKTNGRPQQGILKRVADRFINQKTPSSKPLVAQIVRQLPIRAPDIICLCIGGNDHNVFGILENPTPFSIGEAEQGSAPPDNSNRHFVPYHLMKEHFEEYMPLELIKDLFGQFPDAQKLYLNPPPPISDWEHIKAHPGVFRSKLASGPAPVSMRKQLYRVQTEILRETALECEASFVEAHPNLVDAKGFLSKQYYNADPTHGNVAYGEFMLSFISEGVTK